MTAARNLPPADPKAEATAAARLALVGVECIKFAPAGWLLRDHASGRIVATASSMAALQAAADAAQARRVVRA